MVISMKKCICNFHLVLINLNLEKFAAYKGPFMVRNKLCQWYEKLFLFLVSHNYVQSPSDHSLFLKKHANSFTALLVYVDDIVLTGNDNSEIIANYSGLIDVDAVLEPRDACPKYWLIVTPTPTART